MKVRLYFEPLTLEIDYPPDGLFDDGTVDGDEVLLYIEENWAAYVDPSLPSVGALRILIDVPEALQDGE